MKYVATIHFESKDEPLDDIGDFIAGVSTDQYEVTDFHVEEVEEGSNNEHDKTVVE